MLDLFILDVFNGCCPSLQVSLHDIECILSKYWCQSLLKDCAICTLSKKMPSNGHRLPVSPNHTLDVFPVHTEFVSLIYLRLLIIILEKGFQILTNNIQISSLRLHWVSVHLTLNKKWMKKHQWIQTAVISSYHVKTTIRFTNILNFQLPGFMLWMQYADAMIFRYHMILNR